MNRILAQVEHRPWPLPSGPWVMAQSWHDLLLAHWPVPVASLREKIPSSLELDTFEGTAWIAVVPFRMSGVRLRGTPAVPGLSSFPELNVRTYVTHGNKPGVWFFSLDAANAVAVGIARRWFHLPYFRAKIRFEERANLIAYESIRTHRGAAEARLRCSYCPAAPVQSAVRGTLEYFLTERYCLYTNDRAGRLIRGEIHHGPWPLQIAEAEFAENTMTEAAGISLPSIAPLLHFSKRQDVVVWAPERIG
jgi:uncharacterized protein YqjF (DUF2071 family)